MASKNLTRCAELSIGTRFSKTLLGIGSLKSAWIWQRCIWVRWTRRNLIASTQVIRRNEENVTVDSGISSRALTQSRVAGMPGLDQSIRPGTVATQQGVCFVNLYVKLYFLSSSVTSRSSVSFYLLHYSFCSTCVGDIAGGLEYGSLHFWNPHKLLRCMSQAVRIQLTTRLLRCIKIRKHITAMSVECWFLRIFRVWIFLFLVWLILWRLQAWGIGVQSFWLRGRRVACMGLVDPVCCFYFPPLKVLEVFLLLFMY